MRLILKMVSWSISDWINPGYIDNYLEGLCQSIPKLNKKYCGTKIMS